MKKFTLLVVTSFSIGISILLIVIFTRVNEEYTNTSDIGKKQYKEFKKIKNVVLIIACSLRADHLSCYGYERKTSPNIDRLAKEGILFKNCFSQAPYTVHSVASIMTSKYPRKLFGLKWYINLLDQEKTFAEIFKEEGFYTLGFMANPWPSKPFNFDQGFDYFFDSSDLLKRYKTETERLANRVWGEEVLREIFGKLKEVKSKFFLQALFIDNHVPYTPFPPFRGKFTAYNPKNSIVDRYDETILNFDSHIGKLVEALRELSLLDSTLIIFTADHGDAFAKFHQYDITHGKFLYNTVIKIPLIFYNPNLPKKGVAYDGYITSMDILPTTLDLMRIPLICPH